MKQIGEVYQPKSAKGNARKREINIVGECPVRTKACLLSQIHAAGRKILVAGFCDLLQFDGGLQSDVVLLSDEAVGPAP